MRPIILRHSFVLSRPLTSHLVCWSVAWHSDWGKESLILSVKRQIILRHSFVLSRPFTRHPLGVSLDTPIEVKSHSFWVSLWPWEKDLQGLYSCDPLLHTTLIHITSHSIWVCIRLIHRIPTATHCNTLQHNATHWVCIRLIHTIPIMGWLWWVGSFKLQVSFAKEPYNRDYILQKRPVIWRSLLIVANP